MRRLEEDIQAEAAANLIKEAYEKAFEASSTIGKKKYEAVAGMGRRHRKPREASQYRNRSCKSKRKMTMVKHCRCT